MMVHDPLGWLLALIFLPYVLRVVKILFRGLPEAADTPPQPKRHPVKKKEPRHEPADDGWFSFDERIIHDYDPRSQK